MPDKREFVQFLIESGALRFGSFVTKSGRESPYFINMGMIRTGSALGRLASWYAREVAVAFRGRVDNLFGPAYKGIPLCAATAAALDAEHGLDLSFTYNRKEAKDHGEGGILVGDAYDEPRRVLIIEDVTTAGTSIRETMAILANKPNASVTGLLVSVDRKEKLDSGRSALEEVRREYGIEARSIADIDDILDFVSEPDRRAALGMDDALMDRIKAYRERYGA